MLIMPVRRMTPPVHPIRLDLTQPVIFGEEYNCSSFSLYSFPVLRFHIFSCDISKRSVICYVRTYVCFFNRRSSPPVLCPDRVHHLGRRTELSWSVRSGLPFWTYWSSIKFHFVRSAHTVVLTTVLRVHKTALTRQLNTGSCWNINLCLCVFNGIKRFPLTHVWSFAWFYSCVKLIPSWAQHGDMCCGALSVKLVS
jgi:hypothetical protein